MYSINVLARGDRVLFEGGILTTEKLDERTAKVILAATDRATAPIQPSDFLHAAISVGDRRIVSALTMALANGALIDHVRQIIEIHNPAGTAASEFDGSRERFAPQALRVLNEFSAALISGAPGTGLESLMTAVLAHLDMELTILDREVAATALRGHAGEVTQRPAELFDDASHRLRSEFFTDATWLALERACTHAAELGYDRVLRPHCLLALLNETEGLTERLIRLQLSPEVGLARVTAAVSNGLRLSDRPRGDLWLRRTDIGESLATTLRTALGIAAAWGADRVGQHHLLAALLDDPPARLVSILQRDPLRLDLAKTRHQLEQELRESRGSAPPETPFRLPGDLLPAEDLTYLARTEGIAPAAHLGGYVDEVVRALFRRSNNHVLITGHSGVGRTAVVRETARRAASGEISFLRNRRFLRVDCRDVAAAESGVKLAAVIAHAAARTDLVLCLDGLGPLLRAEHGGDHKLVLRAALKEQRIHLFGVMDTTDYEDLLSADHGFGLLVTRVDLREPDREAALDIARDHGRGLEAEFGVTIEPKAVERAVVLSSDYILNERLPGKVARILRRACEDVEYERQHGEEAGVGGYQVGVPEIVSVVSRISGVPESQLSGVGDQGDMDYEKALGEDVVGQAEAVAAVAEELRLIKFGLRSGSVLFFAGQTGVGKSELAKALARFYSASKHLQIYAMGNFTQDHTVSGLIGVAAGYHGHERGGRLVNDLNADPYCVILLDEAEKAHPDIWKPFLNLFDEGWIEDQRGIRAFSDRAIFILTSNAGAETISRMSAEGRPTAEIAQEVRDLLPTIRHKHTQEQVFPPEFLARIRRTIVFRSLDRAAMAGICRKMLAKRERFWSEKREKRLVVPGALVEYIATVSDQENRASGGREGGRIVDKKIAELVEDAIVRAAKAYPDAYLNARAIELSFLPGPPPEVHVLFRRDDPAAGTP